MNLTRREALLTGAVAALGGCARFNCEKTEVSFASVEEAVRLSAPWFCGKCRFMVIGDSHLPLDDARGEPFRQFSGRMAGGYGTARHFKTGAEIKSPEGFEYALAEAKRRGVDFIALVGDIVSFPSEAGVEYVAARMKECGIAWMYTAGNHDWHYEGLPGTEAALRTEWTKRRLAPLYRGCDPLMSSCVVNGVRFVFIDNSTYEILPEQLEYFNAEAAMGDPIALMVHIPLYMPGYSVREAGCAHPEWGGKADVHWKVERRPRWPERGHSQTTFAFRRAVVSARNLLGVFAGHEHMRQFAFGDGVVQCVTGANADGSFLEVSVN